MFIVLKLCPKKCEHDSNFLLGGPCGSFVSETYNDIIVPIPVKQSWRILGRGPEGSTINPGIILIQITTQSHNCGYQMKKIRWKSRVSAYYLSQFQCRNLLLSVTNQYKSTFCGDIHLRVRVTKMAAICQRMVILLQLYIDMIDITLTFHLIPNTSQLEPIEHCYKVISPKVKFLSARYFGIQVLRDPSEKSCKKYNGFR